VSPSNDAPSRANGDFGGRCILFLLSPLLLYLLLLVVYVAFRKREEAQLQVSFIGNCNSRIPL